MHVVLHGVVTHGNFTWETFDVEHCPVVVEVGHLLGIERLGHVIDVRRIVAVFRQR